MTDADPAVDPVHDHPTSTIEDAPLVLLAALRQVGTLCAAGCLFFPGHNTVYDTRPLCEYRVHVLPTKTDAAGYIELDYARGIAEPHFTQWSDVPADAAEEVLKHAEHVLRTRVARLSRQVAPANQELVELCAILDVPEEGTRFAVDADRLSAAAWIRGQDPLLHAIADRIEAGEHAPGSNGSLPRLEALREISRLCGYEGTNVASPDAVVRMVQGVQRIARKRHEINRELSRELEQLHDKVNLLEAMLYANRT